MYQDYDDEYIPFEVDISTSVYAAARKQDADFEQNFHISDEAVNLPEDVKKFISSFHRNLLSRSVFELHYFYENLFNKLTDKYYTKQAWPEPELIAGLVGDDQLFLTLYKELYFRHIYSKLHPSLDVRFQSYENYCSLFNYILNSDGPVNLELPNQWLWDIIDEFIYQFQSFCQYRSKVKPTSDEYAALQENANVWSSYSVLNVLYSLIQKSGINASSGSKEAAEGVDKYKSKTLYKSLGFFSTIGLLRLHTLLGNYTAALKTMDGIELNKRTLMNRVTACHVTAFYYVGFCYLMLRRYADAHRSFSHILVHMSRSKNYQTKSYQFDQINKKVEQMYALLAIVVALYPTRIDDSISFTLKEKHSDHIAKMRSGSEGLAVFEELFLYACPKFIFAKPTPLVAAEDGAFTTVEPYQRHLQVFLDDIKVQSLLPTLRSYLGLYTSLSVSKLATFVEIQPEELLAQLIVLKQRSLQKRWTSGNLLSGELHLTHDIDFVIQGDLITISEIKMSRRTGDFFLRQTSKFQDLIDHLNKSKQ